MYTRYPFWCCVIPTNIPWKPFCGWWRIFNESLSLSLSLSNWPPCPPILLIIGRWYHEPVAEDMWALCSIPLVLTDTLSIAVVFCLLLRLIYLPTPQLLSTSATCASSRIPSRLMLPWYHHLFKTGALGRRPAARHRSKIGLVAIYCETLFWRQAK